MKWKGLILTNAELVDAWRVFPRTFVCGYGLLVVHVSDWYMGLAAPNNAQAAFASAVIGISGPILNWYMKTGRDWSAKGSDGPGDWDDHRHRGAGRRGRVESDCEDDAGSPRRRADALADTDDFPGERPPRARAGEPS